MFSQPKVSVLIPIYGVEEYIEKCARSLFAQTLDSVEFIFVNDCTKDQSIEILKRVLENFPERQQQVKIVNHPQNKGLPEARQTGIKAASGKYIIHCDSDDWTEPIWLEDLYNHAENEKTDLVWCDYYKAWPEGVQEIISMNSPLDKGESLASLMATRRIGSLWSCLVRSEIVKDPRIVKAKGNYGEDVVLVMQYVIYCNRQAYLNKPLYHYRVNSNSITQTPNPEIVYRNMDTMIEHNRMIQDFCSQAGYGAAVIPVSLGRMFKAKDKILQLYADDREAQKAWKNFHKELTFGKLLKSNLSLRQKIYTSILLAELFPYLNKYLNLRQRLAW